MGTQKQLFKNELLINAIRIWCQEVHANAIAKGFWDAPRNDGELIALMHSELSEALEGLRRGLHDEHCPDFLNVEIEMADCVIRIMDMCCARGWRLGEAMSAKMEFNATRPHKHGKKF
jgi:NTP pyrophosphatase (non-canonical NTP hydrolase)